MSLGWDDELPRGFQDADIELREFEEQAREFYGEDIFVEDDPEATRLAAVAAVAIAKADRELRKQLEAITDPKLRKECLDAL